MQFLELFLELALACILTLSATDSSSNSDGGIASPASANCSTERVSRHLATKTPYSFVANTAARRDDPEGCEPRQFWLISRHGTRYPSKRGLQAIVERLPETAAEIAKAVRDGRSPLCEETASMLEGWRPGASLEDEKNLHAEGELEMGLLAERFQSRFPALISQDYHPELFTFRATASQRATRSQFYFASGLFGRNVALADVLFQESVRPHDPLIRFYKVCSKWQRDVKQNPESLREQRLFEESDVLRKGLLEPVTKRLGYSEVLTLSDIDNMYNGCVFGQAWNPSSPAPWCQVFTQEELDLLEYREDLEYYWQDGYGYELSQRQACVLAKNVLENFDNVTRGVEGEEKGVFYFSHSGAILKFLSYLGLFHDDKPLRHNNYADMKARKWRTSLFNSFGSNVAFALQKCQGEGDQEGLFRVGMYVNEKLTRIPGCSELWCEFQEFFRVFESSRECSLEELCALDSREEEEGVLEAATDDRY